MNSILQEDNTRCYICGMNSNLEPLDRHHVFAGSNRKNSEKYGLTVYLHHSKCHIFGKYSVHQNARVNEMVRRQAQVKAMEYYNWNTEDFIKIFGRNYT